MFIVAENTGSVNIKGYMLKLIRSNLNIVILLNIIILTSDDSIVLCIGVAFYFTFPKANEIKNDSHLIYRGKAALK